MDQNPSKKNPKKTKNSSKIAKIALKWKEITLNRLEIDQK
jgi:hypothetical protein